MQSLIPFIVLFISLFPIAAHANALTDLKAALARSQGSSTVTASFEAKIWRRDGDGKEADENTGEASVLLEEGASGLRLQYSRDIMLRADAEDRAKEKDARTKTPISNALRTLHAGEARDMTWASQSLERALEKAIFKTEKPDIYNGKAARLVHFEMGQDKISEKDRKYVKQFDGSFDVWIDADGTPLASRSHYHVSGRAFLVVTFETDNDEDIVYGLTAGRLIATRKETRTKGSGAGEKSESRTTRSLVLR